MFERRAEEPNLTRAFAVHARTLELLDARGLADRLLPRGLRVQSVSPAPGASLDLGILPGRYPHAADRAPERHRAAARGAGPRARRADPTAGARSSAWRRTTTGVRLELQGPDGPDTVTAAYVVGTDGAHSAVRRLIGVDFAGEQYATHIMLADVRLARPPGETLFGATTTEGLVLFVPFGDGWFRAIAWDRSREEVPLAEPVTLRRAARLVPAHRGRRLRHGRAALEHPVPAASAARRAATARGGCSSRATPPTCTPRSAARA